jgi:hypothetical protein
VVTSSPRRIETTVLVVPKSRPRFRLFMVTMTLWEG